MIAVFQQANDLRLDAELFPVLGEKFFHQGKSIFERPAEQIGLKDFWIIPDIEGACPIAVGFGNKQPPLVIEVKRNWIP